MKILGIETSCDETAVAIVEGKGERARLLRELVASQISIHKKYGGVVPEIAARSHAETLPLLIKKILGAERERAFDAIAVTAGPGLITSLRVGVEAARALAFAWKKPLIAVNHLEGHIAANWLDAKKAPEFPALALVVSGGHTELVWVPKHGVYKLLGATRDDAAGEAFDKVAKMLGLGYPGGPAVSKKAESGNPDAIDFPRPMMKSGDLDFSFSGLKTAVMQYEGDAGAADICASFQEAVVDVLVAKTITAAKKHRPKTVLLAGGVAANKKLRERLGAAVRNELSGVKYVEPALRYTTDNAAMIATAGYYFAEKKRFADLPDRQAGWRKLEPRGIWEIGSQRK